MSDLFRKCFWKLLFSSTQIFLQGKYIFNFSFFRTGRSRNELGLDLDPAPAPWCARQPPSDWSWLREVAQGNGFNGCQLTEKGSLSSTSFLPSLAGVCLFACAHPRASLTWQTSEEGLMGYVWCQNSEHTVFDAALVGNTRAPGKRRGVGLLPLKMQVLAWLGGPSEKGFHAHCTDINASLQNEC